MIAAAYCRVSTDQEDQANSFESQQRYFREYIERQPGWELYEIYADEGITGTSTKKRAAFNRMICDARMHRFDLILTKEVSRFSRNLLDSVSYTRELKRMGIGVQFMNDGINTLDPDAELRLSILSSIAQEESRKTSSRVKWGQTRRMEQGVVFGRSLLGYDVRDGKMTVNPEGAEIVRLIFHKYVYERKGTTVIARELREAGIRTLTGSVCWRNTVILKILRNEKYCGDLKQKKTYTPDYLTHEKKYNHGQEDYVFIRNHHEPILSRELWEAAQQEMARRSLKEGAGQKAPGCGAPGKNEVPGHGSRYPLSGKIRCSQCGRSFVSRIRTGRDGEPYRTWRCGTATAEGKRRVDPAGYVSGCDLSYQIRDQVGMDLVKQAVSTLQIDRDAVVSHVTELVWNVRRTAGEAEQLRAEKIKEEIRLWEQKKKRVLDAFISEQISEEDLQLMNREYDSQLAKWRSRLAAAEKQEGHPIHAGGLGEDIAGKIRDIVNGETATARFYGNLLDRITAYPDRHGEVQLKLLPQKWEFPFSSERDRQNKKKSISISSVPVIQSLQEKQPEGGLSDAF